MNENKWKAQTVALNIDLDRIRRRSLRAGLNLTGRKVDGIALDLIESMMGLWDLGLIDKWDFYPVCQKLVARRWITIGKIAEASGIPRRVVSMRLSDLRKM